MNLYAASRALWNGFGAGNGGAGGAPLDWRLPASLLILDPLPFSDTLPSLLPQDYHITLYSPTWLSMSVNGVIVVPMERR